MPEDFEDITNPIYRAMNSTKLLGICIMRLSGLKETTLHGLRWNNSLTLSTTFICDWFIGSKCCVWLQGCPAHLCIFLVYETQSVRLRQVNGSRFYGISIYNVPLTERTNAQSFFLVFFYLNHK
ncbi:hypothetical protein RRG08_008736 [Elysia crispata]|uniref:Uncharacterized protein n=1 Tax=Elysia crispata TaxID=231223 RepID=A0AAE1D5M6_9GAST|nr:hypothetical protein RRG08_008736 [Elysia crispata]